MMADQVSFSDLEGMGATRKSRIASFLEQMDGIVPWGEWLAVIEPHYYAASGGPGRPPVPLETMLRMYLLQCWYSLSDEACEDACWENRSMTRFLGIDPMSGRVPDATTLAKFRHLLEDEGLAEEMFDALNRLPWEAGAMMRGGSIVDATIIDAPSSTKNASGGRDPEMHQTKKGNQWRFGMKAHIGADAGSGLVHTVTGTAANVADVCEASKLVRRGEDGGAPGDSVVYGDSGYLGVQKRDEVVGDEGLAGVDWRIAKRPSQLKEAEYPNCAERAVEHRKASTRCKVEHPFKIVKRDFGFAKVPYRGIRKNLSRLHVLFASANLVMLARAGWESLSPPAGWAAA